MQIKRKWEYCVKNNTTIIWLLWWSWRFSDELVLGFPAPSFLCGVIILHWLVPTWRYLKLISQYWSYWVYLNSTNTYLSHWDKKFIQPLLLSFLFDHSCAVGFFFSIFWHSLDMKHVRLLWLVAKSDTAFCICLLMKHTGKR